MLLQLSDGVTTVTLSGATGILGCTYFPGTPELDAGRYADMTETAHVNLRGSAAMIRSTVNAVERLLQQAHRRQTTGDGARVFVHYRPVDTESTWRSEVLDGRVIFSDNPALRRLGDANPTVRIAVIWTRRYYWEGAQQDVPAVNLINGTPDGGLTNVATWAGIAGTLSTPARIEVANNNLPSLNTRYAYIANDAFDIFLGAYHLLTPTFGSESVGWVSGASHDTVQFSLAVTGPPLAGMNGQSFQVLAAFSALPPDIYVRAGVYARRSGAHTLLHAGAERYSGIGVGQQLLDLGTLPIPPTGRVADAPGNWRIGISFYAQSSGSATLRFVQLTPTNSVRLRLTGAAWDNQARLVQVPDQEDDVSYLSDDNTTYPLVSGAGRLWLYPERTNRLSVLFDEGDAFDPTRQMLLSGSYRPRRLTV